MKTSVFVAGALAAVAAAPIADEGLNIGHEAVGCVVAARFPAIAARITPPERVARAEIHFRAAGTVPWYRVPMKAQGNEFRGVLPRPKRGLKGIDYYIEATSDAMASRRTPEYAAAVVDGPAACRDRLAAGTETSAAITVAAPAGSPVLPVGFETAGIAGAGAAAAAAGAAAGGIGATALVVGGVAAAGAATALVTAGGDSTTTTTTTTLPRALTGRWSGTFFENDTVGQCTANWRLTLDLVEDGGRLTGTMALDGISSTTGVYRCAGAPGERFDGWVLAAGSISGTSVRMPFTRPFPAGAVTFLLEGSVGADRMTMSGTWGADVPSQYYGTWTATRQ
jgi:hypothetical protein